MDMAEEDERVRADLAATGELFRSYPPRMAEVHHRNGNELQVVIEQYGWPGKFLVGEDGAKAAWLILLHAIGKAPHSSAGPCLFCKMLLPVEKLHLPMPRILRTRSDSSSGVRNATGPKPTGMRTGR